MTWAPQFPGDRGAPGRRLPLKRLGSSVRRSAFTQWLPHPEDKDRRVSYVSSSSDDVRTNPRGQPASPLTCLTRWSLSSFTCAASQRRNPARVKVQLSGTARLSFEWE